MSPASPSTGRNTRAAKRLRYAAVANGLLAVLLAAGCVNQAEVQLRAEVADLKLQIEQKNTQLLLQRAQIDELNRQLEKVTGPVDLQRVIYPDHLVIDKISGGDDYDGKLGDDGVTIDTFYDRTDLVQTTLRTVGHNLLEGGIRIPFMMTWKGHLPSGRVDDRPVIQLDIMPTAGPSTRLT